MRSVSKYLFHRSFVSIFSNHFWSHCLLPQDDRLKNKNILVHNTTLCSTLTFPLLFGHCGWFVVSSRGIVSWWVVHMGRIVSWGIVNVRRIVSWWIGARGVRGVFTGVMNHWWDMVVWRWNVCWWIMLRWVIGWMLVVGVIWIMVGTSNAGILAGLANKSRTDTRHYGQTEIWNCGKDAALGDYILVHIDCGFLSFISIQQGLLMICVVR